MRSRLRGWLSERFGRDDIWRNARLHVSGGCGAVDIFPRGTWWLVWDEGRSMSMSLADSEHLAKRRWCRACRRRNL